LIVDGVCLVRRQRRRKVHEDESILRQRSSHACIDLHEEAVRLDDVIECECVVGYDTLERDLTGRSARLVSYGAKCRRGEVDRVTADDALEREQRHAATFESHRSLGPIERTELSLLNLQQRGAGVHECECRVGVGYMHRLCGNAECRGVVLRDWCGCRADAARCCFGRLAKRVDHRDRVCGRHHARCWWKQPRREQDDECDQDERQYRASVHVGRSG
jgi:hypothetical protein